MKNVVIAASALLLVALLVLVLSLDGSAQAVTARELPQPQDPAAELQQRIDNGSAMLDFDAKWGYLRSVLTNLRIPVSSQALVFSKSSLQFQRISPATPRALYFNDDVYVGWVQGGPVIEIASMDPKSGPVFYTLSQEQGARPKFERQVQCLSCHYHVYSRSTAPRLLLFSSLSDPTGNIVGLGPLLTSDQSPLEERWGGWYVTGTHGAQRHLGNLMVRSGVSEIGNITDYIPQLDLSTGANVTDLSSRFDTTPYLSRHSDIVGLMVLAHQTEVHNLIALASSKVQAAVRTEQLAKTASRNTEPQRSGTVKVAGEEGESLLRAMVFTWAEPLTAPIAGTSGFAAEFASQGPRDSLGRSLRDLELKTRLFRYPLSYLIYSEAFNQMPDVLKQYVYRRLKEVLTGEDKSKDFAHLSKSDREAILEILKDTKPDFAGSPSPN